MEKLPIEMLEAILLKTFVRIFRHHYAEAVVRAEEVTYSTLTAVSYNWWQTVHGWPQSDTRHWFKRKLLKQLYGQVCKPYVPRPMLLSTIPEEQVEGIAECDNKLFIVLSRHNTVYVYDFPSTASQNNVEPIGEIVVRGLGDPRGVVACADTRQLFIADHYGSVMQLRCGSVRRVSIDGSVNDAFVVGDSKDSTNSISLGTKSAERVVVTCKDLIYVYSYDGRLQRHIDSSELVGDFCHAAETVSGTLIVGHLKPYAQVSEVDASGAIIRSYRGREMINFPYHLSVDSDGRVLVVNFNSSQLLLLTAELHFERVLLDEQHYKMVPYPICQCYVEKFGVVVVAGETGIQAFRIRRPLTSTRPNISKRVKLI